MEPIQFMTNNRLSALYFFSDEKQNSLAILSKTGNVTIPASFYYRWNIAKRCFVRVIICSVPIFGFVTSQIEFQTVLHVSSFNISRVPVGVESQWASRSCDASLFIIAKFGVETHTIHTYCGTWCVMGIWQMMSAALWQRCADDGTRTRSRCAVANADAAAEAATDIGAWNFSAVSRDFNMHTLGHCLWLCEWISVLVTAASSAMQYFAIPPTLLWYRAMANPFLVQSVRLWQLT